ncbi:DnaT-like ssDNA-binding domain-containing protein [Pseudothauera rhizosphaerae]|uniref:DnaT DNA-binding domain-containing protein n=1 Tax=Pseudothauera rhizosphaerae TaxID=2565932 RepID=A0A4S4AAK6_9RHOO|nr:DnaT-like ssDNA-binding domain-containing protein [Pseudothauera rhizosphaerae]THF55936.1 hypothetical protein E6O51_20330 [Pseudothauera rhizosphaerae]
MARIRTIKPEFWTAEQVMELSPMARLLFIGMWNFCDDRGVHPVAYKTLKAEVFPADDLLSSDVEKLVGELITQGLLIEFEAESRRWWFVTGWHHQVINRPSKSRYPEPPRGAPLPSAAGQDEQTNAGADSTVCHGALADDSLSDHGALTDGREGKGRERSKPPPSSPSARACETGPPSADRVPMHSEWRPSSTFATLAHQAGLPIPGNAEFDAARVEFVAYWLTRADQRTQHEWDHAFIRSLKNDRIKAQSAPRREDNHGKPQRRSAAEQRADTIAELTGCKRDDDDAAARTLQGEARVVG